MAASTVLTSQLIALAGITGDLATALVDRTAAAVADDLRTILRLKGISEAIDGGAISSYTISGRSVATSMDLIEKALRLVDALASSGGRVGVSVGVEFSA